VLFPPHFTRETVKGKMHVLKGEDDEAIDYFTNILPRIKRHGGPSLVSQMIEVIQEPGETIFVPGGWWHAVLNIEDTIAITQVGNLMITVLNRFCNACDGCTHA
jgi:histone arginine demethylase JMJD6